MASNGLFAQSLFYSEQAFEKANKSIIVYFNIFYFGNNEEEVYYELKKEYGHFNKKVTANIIKILIDKEKEKYLSMGGSEEDEFITKPYQLLDDFQKNDFKQKDLIPFFDNAIKRIYDRYYLYFGGKRTDQSLDPKVNYIHDQYKNPISRYQLVLTLIP